MPIHLERRWHRNRPCLSIVALVDCQLAFVQVSSSRLTLGQIPFLPGARIPFGSRAFLIVSFNLICALLLKLYVFAI